MKRDVERVRVLLPSDPALNSEPELSVRAERELMALRRSTARPAPRRRALGRRDVLAGAAVLTGASAVVLHGGLPWPGRDGGTPAVAVTPPVLTLTPVSQKPSVYLRRLADQVAALPAESAPSAYQYTKTWGWWLNTAADAPGGAANAAVPTVTETWIDRRDSGRRLETYGDPIFPTPQREQAARDAGLVPGKEVEDKTYAVGKAPGQMPWGSLGPLSSDPDELARQLRTVNWEAGMVVFGVSDMLQYAARSGPVSPALRAAALRVLAGFSGLTVSTTTTWKGQHVVAVTQEEIWRGSTKRCSAFFDPRTGYPMGSEEALFGSPLKLNVQVPATLTVAETLERAPVASVDERP